MLLVALKLWQTSRPMDRRRHRQALLNQPCCYWRLVEFILNLYISMPLYPNIGESRTFKFPQPFFSWTYSIVFTCLFLVGWVTSLWRAWITACSLAVDVSFSLRYLGFLLAVFWHRKCCWMLSWLPVFPPVFLAPPIRAWSRACSIIDVFLGI